MPNSPSDVPARERPAARRGCNPFAGVFRFIANRLSCALIVFVAIFGGVAACALFAPTFFQQSIRIAQSAGLNVYTLVLGVTGNPALRVTTYDATVTAVTTINRDMGIFSVLYGEGAKVEGTMRISLGADLKNGAFGVIACDIDYRTVRLTENRAPLSNFAFDPNSIKQEALLAFSTEAANQALAQYWLEAAKGLRAQFFSWGLGVTIPDQPTLRTCPAAAPG